MDDLLYDAAVIGGGPSGSTAAYVLAREGHRTLILEKDRFPRHHIGESLLPRVKGLYRRLDLVDKLKGEGFVPKLGAQILDNDGTCEIAFDFSTNPDPELMAWQVERDRFDQILLDHARSKGAEVREETLVLSAERGGDGLVRLRVRGPGGAESEVLARWVLDASGQNSLLAKQHGLRVAHPTHKKVAVYTRYRGMERREGRIWGNIEVVVADGGWFWLIPLRDRVTSVGFVADVARWKESGRTAPELLEEGIRRSPYVTGRLGKAERIGEIWTASNYSYTCSSFRGPGFTLVGDSAVFLDPVWSTGVLLAMRTGELAAHTLSKALRSGRSVREDDFVEYEARFRKWAGSCFQMIDAFYEPVFPVVLFNKRDLFGVSDTITRFLAGETEQGWLDRMRLKLFYWLIGAQKKWRFMKDPRTPAHQVSHL
jgi:flavin-dependent dehydrogenase